MAQGASATWRPRAQHPSALEHPSARPCPTLPPAHAQPRTCMPPAAGRSARSTQCSPASPASDAGSAPAPGGARAQRGRDSALAAACALPLSRICGQEHKAQHPQLPPPPPARVGTRLRAPQHDCLERPAQLAPCPVALRARCGRPVSGSRCWWKEREISQKQSAQRTSAIAASSALRCMPRFIGIAIRRLKEPLSRSQSGRAQFIRFQISQ